MSCRATITLYTADNQGDTNDTKAADYNLP
jgi:hypothetical protein